MKFKAFSKGVKFVAKHGTTILTAAAVVGVGATVYLAVKKAPKVDETITTMKKDGENRMAIAVAAAKEAWAPLLVGGVTCACIIAAQKINLGKIAGVTGSLAYVENKYQKLLDKTTNELGAEKINKIKDEIASEEISTGRKGFSDHVHNTRGGQHLILDEWSGRYFRASKAWVKEQLAEANNMLLADDVISMNDVYDCMELPAITAGEDYGYQNEGSLIRLRDFGDRSYVSPEGEPCLVMEFYPRPKPLTHRIYA